jgi:hypothetical protein
MADEMVTGFDWFGGAAERAPLKFDPKVIGSTGLRQYGGMVEEEFLKELKGLRGSSTYREMMDNDATVGAVLFAVSMLLRKASWEVQAADDSQEADDAKAFVEDVLFNGMTKTWEDFIDEVCSMFGYGFAPHEIIWLRRDDGKIGIKDLPLRAQPTVVRWAIDETDGGSIDGLWQQPLAGPQVFIPIEKLLLFRTTVARNNPEGRSILRTAYRSWKFKKRVEEIEGVGVERDLAGLPIAKIPGRFFASDAPPEDKAVLTSWQTLVRNVRNDKQQGIVLPSDTDTKGKPLYEFELLSSAGSRSIDTTKIVDRYDRQIATSVLADFIFLGQKAVGSFALSSDKTALFSTAIGGFLDAICSVLNKHLLVRLWKLNGFDPEMMPKLKPGDVESANLQELGGFITSLAGAGMALFPDVDLENHLRETAGLPPMPEEGIDYTTPPLPTAGPGAAMAVAEHATSLPQPPNGADGASEQ